MGALRKIDVTVTYAEGGGIILHATPSEPTKYKYIWHIDNLGDDYVKKNFQGALETYRLELNAKEIAMLEPGRHPGSIEVTDINTKKQIGTPEKFEFIAKVVVKCSVAKGSFTEGDPVDLYVDSVDGKKELDDYQFSWDVPNDQVEEIVKAPRHWQWDTTGVQPKSYQPTVTVYRDGVVVGECRTDPVLVKQRQFKKGDVLPVTMRRTASMPTDDQGLWSAIRNRCEAVSFPRYNEFIQAVFCGDPLENVIETTKNDYDKKFGSRDLNALDARLSLNSVDAYNVLKLATEVFLLLESGVILQKNNTSSVLTADDFFDESEESDRFNENVMFSTLETKLTRYLSGTNGKLPYFDRIVSALVGLDPKRGIEKLPYCDGILQHRFSSPSLLELIWSYWHEEGMLVQTMNAIALRFQNRRGSADRDPLAELVIDPLRPLNNLLWGYIQNEHNRLTIPRRTYEYDSQYGLSLYGKAVPKLRSADSRSKFLEAFHNLLYRTSIFYREDADTTVIADAFPLLKAIREVHLILAEGAHNQFGDLPWTARIEMMIEQWLLARPEMQEFLRGRPMVPYREDWMGRVDAMKKHQGWTDTTITHFQELGMYGEQILLSIRYGDWIVVNNEDQAKNWARYWKPEIQGYIHAYRAATGVDLNSEPVDASPPWVHLRRQEEKKRANLR